MSKGARFNNEEPKGKKKLALGWKIAIGVLSVILALVIAAVSIFFYYFGGLRTSPLTKDSSELGIDSQVEEDTNNMDITNIALFGVDSRDDDDTGRSDAMMIMSVDKTHGKIKLTSIARDTRVYLTDRGEYNKIAHAYAFGGPEMSIKTINQNFKLNIKEYITVNFEQLANVIDGVGGVTIPITEQERIAANENIAALGINDPIQKSGTVLLTGDQAVGYSRIRKIDSDDMRAQRQRNVLNAIFEQMKGKNTLEYADFIRKLLPNVETSLDYGDLMGMASIMFGSVTMEQKAFPNEDSKARGGIFYPDGLWYYDYDLDLAAQQLHQFIYEKDN